MTRREYWADLLRGVALYSGEPLVSEGIPREFAFCTNVPIEDFGKYRYNTEEQVK